MISFSIFSLLGFHSSLGCVLCFPVPVKSVADYLLEGECVVLAKLNSKDPFSYEVDRTLKGELESTKIDLFVDTMTRRRLRVNPKSRVVLARQTDSDTWRSLGIADARFQQVVERIIGHQTIWSDPGGEKERVKFFIRLFDDKHPAIFELAYLELARAPYSVIRSIGRVMPKRQIHNILARREFVEWRPLAILLLAQNPDDADKLMLDQLIESVKKFPRQQELAATITAWVEYQGVSAIDEIEAIWLAPSDGQSLRNEDEQKRVLSAFKELLPCSEETVRSRLQQVLEQHDLASEAKPIR